MDCSLKGRGEGGGGGYSSLVLTIAEEQKQISFRGEYQHANNNILHTSPCHTFRYR